MLPPRHRRAAFKAFWSYWPRRLLGERGVLIVLLALCVIVMLASVIAPRFTQRVRAATFDQLDVTLSMLATPAKKFSMMVEHMTGLSNMSNDLEILRQENDKLRQWYDRARQLEAENRSLRSLVNLAEMPQSNAVTTRVIAESGGMFDQSIIVDAGEKKKVSPDSIAMTGNGVIGRTMMVSKSSTLVLLLTDATSRIPVVIENSRHRGMLAGDNSPRPKLNYLPNDASVSVGERVLTSGDAGLYAPGLPVGVVVSVHPGNVRIQPFADLRRLDFVQLIDFGRGALLKEAQQSFGNPDGSSGKTSGQGAP